MALTNYVRTRSRKNGGIRMLGLIERSEIAEVTAQGSTTEFTAITFEEGCCFSKYEFREDEAVYKESVSVSNGARIVTHELSFLLDKMGSECSAAVSAIAEAADEGLIAIVQTTNGDTFLVGYSQEFGKERPLRLDSSDGTTGKQLSDGTSEVVTLSSTDVAKARIFAGDLNALFVSA